MQGYFLIQHIFYVGIIEGMGVAEFKQKKHDPSTLLSLTIRTIFRPDPFIPHVSPDRWAGQDIFALLPQAEELFHPGHHQSISIPCKDHPRRQPSGISR